MTDQGPVERFREVLGFGSIHLAKRAQPHWKPIYRYEAGGWKNLTLVRERFGPYLFERRLAQLDDLLALRPVRVSSPTCGDPSPAAYRRHLRRGEPACVPCRHENTSYERARLGMTARYPDGTGYDIALSG
jgi:hypothetical protein